MTTPIGYDGVSDLEASPRGAPASGLATPIGAVASSVVELHGALEKKLLPIELFGYHACVASVYNACVVADMKVCVS